MKVNLTNLDNEYPAFLTYLRKQAPKKQIGRAMNCGGCPLSRWVAMNNDQAVFTIQPNDDLPIGIYEAPPDEVFDSSDFDENIYPWKLLAPLPEWAQRVRRIADSKRFNAIIRAGWLLDQLEPA